MANLVFSKKPKICLTTYFDNKFGQIGKLCVQSIKKYAETFNYDFCLLNNIKSERPASWNKILIIQELFKKNYDFVFWVDADAIFIRFNRDIADEVVESKDLYLTKYYPPNGEIPNMGIFLIRKSDWSTQLLNNLWKMEKYINHYWWENSAFIDLCGLVEKLPVDVKKTFTQPYSRSNEKLLNKIKFLGPIWNSWYGLTAKNPIINHYAALPLQIKFKLMFLDNMIASINPNLVFYKNKTYFKLTYFIYQMKTTFKSFYNRIFYE